jgi:hypothetical protein
MKLLLFLHKVDSESKRKLKEEGSGIFYGKHAHNQECATFNLLHFACIFRTSCLKNFLPFRGNEGIPRSNLNNSNLLFS